MDDKLFWGVELEWIAPILKAKPDFCGYVSLPDDSSSSKSQRTPVKEDLLSVSDDVKSDKYKRWARAAEKWLTMATIVLNEQAGNKLQVRSVRPKQGHLSNETTDVKLGQCNADGIFDAYAKHWTLSQEESLMYHDKGREDKMPLQHAGVFWWCGFEVASEVFPGIDEGETKIRLFCSALRQNFDVAVNLGRGKRRPGVHVHWSRRGGFSDLAIRKLLTVMWVIEDSLMDLHASWRYGEDGRGYASRLRDNSILSLTEDEVVDFNLNIQKLPSYTEAMKIMENTLHGDMHDEDEFRRYVPAPDSNTPSLRDDEHIKRIWRAKTMKDIVELSCCRDGKYLRGAIGLQETLPWDSEHQHMKIRSSQLNTIEFRHMQGSLDPDNIMAWVKVTERIIQVCVPTITTDSEYKRILGGLWGYTQQGGQSRHILGMLDIMGVDDAEALEFFKKKPQSILDDEWDPDKTDLFLPPNLDGPVSREGQ